MPRLTVLGAAPAVSSGTRASLSLPTLIGFIALIAAGGALVLLIRTRAAWAAALTLVAALVCVVSFAVTAKNATARAGGDPSPADLGPEASPADLGQALFLAKGCVVCHSHGAVLDARKDFADFNVGPNLSKVSRSPDYVRVWLKDPPALKPDTQMPNLGLSSEEIEALIAFLKPGASQ
jgi:mono/diheme cytochrome c family protein